MRCEDSYGYWWRLFAATEEVLPVLVEKVLEIILHYMLLACL